MEEKIFMGNVVNFSIKNENIIIYDGNKIRILKSANIPTKDVIQNSKFNRDSGLINLNRIIIQKPKFFFKGLPVTLSFL